MSDLKHDVGQGGRGRLSQAFDGGLVFADYRREGDALAILHVEADPGLRGSGAAGVFMWALTDWARRNGETLRPRCPYAVHWYARHPDASDVLARDL